MGLRPLNSGREKNIEERKTLEKMQLSYLYFLSFYFFFFVCVLSFRVKYYNELYVQLRQSCVCDNSVR